VLQAPRPVPARQTGISADELVPGLRRLGEHEEADRIVHGLATAALRSGLREYYDPLTGRGLGARGFGWSALVTDLAAGLWPDGA